MADFALVLQLSPSTAEDYLNCARYYELKHVYGLRQEDTLAQSFGRILHTGYDIYYASRNVDAAVEKIKELWPGDSTEDKARTLVRAEKTMRSYAERYETDGITIHRPSDEESIIVPLDEERGWAVAMKMDKIVRWAGSYRVMEHKTTSSLTATTLDRFNPNIQVKTYIWGARKMGLVDGDIAGAIIDVTGVNVQKLDFKRDTISMTAQQEVELVNTLKEICRQIVEADERGFYLPNWKNCTMYGECYYRSRICKHSPEIQAVQIEQLINKKKEQDEAKTRNAASNRID